jgi:hypothetical protein
MTRNGLKGQPLSDQKKLYREINRSMSFFGHFMVTLSGKKQNHIAARDITFSPHKAIPNPVAKAKAKLQFCFCFCKIPSLTIAKHTFCKSAVLQIAKLYFSFARMQN